MLQSSFQASRLASPGLSALLLGGTPRRDQTLDAWLWGHTRWEEESEASSRELPVSLSLSLPSVHRGLGPSPEPCLPAPVHFGGSRGLQSK